MSKNNGLIGLLYIFYCGTYYVLANQDNVEALMSLMAANEMKSMGKGEKALKLIEHGIALAPKNPDLLNGYGELIETLRDDILTADQMYYQVCLLR